MNLFKLFLKGTKSLAKNLPEVEKAFVQHGDLLNNALKSGDLSKIDDVLKRLKNSGDDGIKKLADTPAFREALENISQLVGRHGDALDNLSKQLDTNVKNTKDFKKALINSDIPEGSDLYKALSNNAEDIVKAKRIGLRDQLRAQVEHLTANPGKFAGNAAKGAWNGTKDFAKFVGKVGFTSPKRMGTGRTFSMGKSIATVVVGSALADRITDGASTSVLAWGSEHALGFAWKTSKIFSSHVADEIKERLPESVQDKRVLYATDENDELIVFSPEQYAAAYKELSEDERSEYMTPEEYKENMPTVVQSLKDMANEAGVDATNSSDATVNEETITTTATLLTAGGLTALAGDKLKNTFNTLDAAYEDGSLQLDNWKEKAAFEIAGIFNESSFLGGVLNWILGDGLADKFRSWAVAMASDDAMDLIQQGNTDFTKKLTASAGMQVQAPGLNA